MRDATSEELLKVIENGTLHEVNRLLLHPLGLALCVHADDDGKPTGISLLRDDDPEGTVFAPNTLNRDKAEAFRVAFEARCEHRKQVLGFGVQSAGDALTVTRVRV